MIKVERFINELMTSNCYLVVDEASKHCLCIDPASENSEREIEYIEKNKFTLDYIILTHEHTDHTWGVNALLEAIPKTKVICSELCKESLPHEAQAYFRFYYDDTNYSYNVKRVDFTTEELNWKLDWCNNIVRFIPAPGHSMGSVCIEINGMLFTGDAILQSKPYINKRNGSKKKFFESAKSIKSTFSDETKIYPGHGDAFPLCEYIVSEKELKMEV